MRRDPLRPIPSPTDRGFWEQAAPPPPTRTRTAAYDPTRLLGERAADMEGVDRRASRRTHPGVEAADHPITAAPLHRNVDGVLGLVTSGGWALVRTLCVGPAGILVKVVDAADRQLDARTRIAMNRALTALSPILGARGRPGDPFGRPSSPLGNVGAHLLGGRVVADAAAWVQGPVRASVEVRRHPVTLVGVPAHRRGSLHRIEGHLAALNDPDPRVLGVALGQTAIRDLELQLRGRGVPR